jgi:hypothetical protein
MMQLKRLKELAINSIKTLCKQAFFLHITCVVFNLIFYVHNVKVILTQINNLVTIM